MPFTGKQLLMAAVAALAIMFFGYLVLNDFQPLTEWFGEKPAVQQTATAQPQIPLWKREAPRCIVDLRSLYGTIMAVGYVGKDGQITGRAHDGTIHFLEGGEYKFYDCTALDRKYLAAIFDEETADRILGQAPKAAQAAPQPVPQQKPVQQGAPQQATPEAPAARPTRPWWIIPLVIGLVLLAALGLVARRLMPAPADGEPQATAPQAPEPVVPAAAPTPPIAAAPAPTPVSTTPQAYAPPPPPEPPADPEAEARAQLERIKPLLGDFIHNQLQAFKGTNQKFTATRFRTWFDQHGNGEQLNARLTALLKTYLEEEGLIETREQLYSQKARTLYVLPPISGQNPDTDGEEDDTVFPDDDLVLQGLLGDE